MKKNNFITIKNYKIPCNNILCIEKNIQNWELNSQINKTKVFGIIPIKSKKEVLKEKTSYSIVIYLKEQQNFLICRFESEEEMDIVFNNL